ncbi:MAG TPA: inositol monophosphatase family protein [Pirellulales bacterium]|jgi:myo-inositol-1(or 4)-monophosphatase|nr:inositol monophosphatase family protein [Pirellulales bacterium]
MNDFLELCERAARAGGQVLLDWVGRFQVREKGPSDLVTEADLASQETIRELLLKARPDDAFVGEETAGPVDRAAEYQWIVDPLDGTTNYVHQLPGYSTSVALVHRGEIVVGAVFDPVSRECYTAARGEGAWLNGNRLRTSAIESLSQALVAVSFGAKVAGDAPELQEFQRVVVRAQAIRRLGSAALNLSYLAAGRFDAYWAGETKAWDVAAGVLLVQEAGGCVTALDGSPFHITRPRFLACANQVLHAELLPLVRRAQA